MGRWDKEKDVRWNKAGRKFNDVCNKHTPHILKRVFHFINSKIRRYVITLTFKQWIFATCSVLASLFILPHLFDANGVNTYWFRQVLAFVPLFLAFSIEYDDDDDDPDKKPTDDDHGIIIKTNTIRSNQDVK